MHFETLQSISLNGDPHKPNDDRCGSTAHLAWVVDGATDMGQPGLLGPQGGAAWLASTASSAFASIVSDTIEETCSRAFAHIETAFHNQRTREVQAAWEVPKAAFSAVQLAESQLGVAWAADCPALLIKDDQVRWCTGEPDTSAEAADARALGAGVGAARELAGEVLENRRAHRAREGHVALSALARSSVAVTCYAQMPVHPGDELILMSDGFASLITDYRLYSAETFSQAVRSKGLPDLLQEVRRIEQEDAACLKYPRFKVSDDATALWLRVCA